MRRTFRMGRRFGAGSLVTLLAIAGCEGAVDVDGGTSGWIRGVVVDQAQIPQDSVLVTVLEEPGGRLGQTRTNALGQFEVGIYLFLIGPGEHPISIAVERGIEADTIRGFSVRTFEQSPSPDTTELRVIVP